MLVTLSNIYSRLRGDTSGVKNEDSAQGFVRSTTKYWVRTQDATTVKHHILQHLPVFQFREVCQKPGKRLAAFAAYASNRLSCSVVSQCCHLCVAVKRCTCCLLASNLLLWPSDCITMHALLYKTGEGCWQRHRLATCLKLQAGLTD